MLHGRKAMRCFITDLSERSQHTAVVVGDTVQLKVFNFLLDEDGQKQRLRLVNKSVQHLRDTASLGTADVVVATAVAGVMEVSAPRMTGKQTLSVDATPASSSTTAVERRQHISKVASVFLKS